MNLDISELITLSNTLGKQISYVQGGGGNTSLKTNGTEMFIKASGKFLADIDDETGFLSVDWLFLKSNIANCVTEQDYFMLLTQSKLTESSSNRPSIETGFHALLDNCTIHTHSVWVNLLTCSKEGESLVRELFPAAIWVDYATPGLALTQAISKQLDGCQEAVIFLQNHGVVISAPNPKLAYNSHEIITATLRNAYPFLADFGEVRLSHDSHAFDGLLFPDQAIYHSSLELSNSRAGRETLLAYLFIMDGIKQIGLTPSFIDAAELQILLNMDSEKFRQELIKQ